MHRKPTFVASSPPDRRYPERSSNMLSTTSTAQASKVESQSPLITVYDVHPASSRSSTCLLPLTSGRLSACMSHLFHGVARGGPAKGRPPQQTGASQRLNRSTAAGQGPRERDKRELKRKREREGEGSEGVGKTAQERRIHVKMTKLAARCAEGANQGTRIGAAEEVTVPCDALQPGRERGTGTCRGAAIQSFAKNDFVVVCRAPGETLRTQHQRRDERREQSRQIYIHEPAPEPEPATSMPQHNRPTLSVSQSVSLNGLGGRAGDAPVFPTIHAAPECEKIKIPIKLTTDTVPTPASSLQRDSQ